MKKITAYLIGLLLVIGGSVSIVQAQGQAASTNAGITPDNPFYFLDKLGETLQEFFTFNPEGKARLQITFAAERIAEIKVTLETKGVRAKGLEVAEAALKGNIAKAAAIVEGEKKKGKDVSELAKEVNDELDEQKEVLKDSFREQKQALKDKIDELKDQIREARPLGDTAKVEALTKQLAGLKAEKELLEQKEDEQEEALKEEEERLEEQMEAKDEAEKAIREAEEEKEEVLDEAVEEGVSLPLQWSKLEKFDRLLAQAKELLEKGNYQGAKQLAKQAEKSLNEVEEAIEELEEEQERQEELKEEEENLREEARREVERLEEEQEKIRDAEKDLRDSSDED